MCTYYTIYLILTDDTETYTPRSVRMVHGSLARSQLSVWRTAPRGDLEGPPEKLVGHIQLTMEKTTKKKKQ